MSSPNQSPYSFDQVQEIPDIELNEQLFVTKEHDIDIQPYETGQSGYQKTTHLECIDYDRLQQIQKQNVMLANLSGRPKWNNCTKIPKHQHQQQKPTIGKMPKKQTKQTCCKKSQELMIRNEKWVKDKEKKLFEKARSQFLRTKDLCYFSPKIL